MRAFANKTCQRKVVKHMQICGFKRKLIIIEDLSKLLLTIIKSPVECAPRKQNIVASKRFKAQNIVCQNAVDNK
jgi:hypothetical protein